MKTTRTYGTLIHGQTGQEIEEGVYDVRRLTEAERVGLPLAVARLDGEPHPVTGDTAEITACDVDQRTFYVQIWTA